MKQYLLYFRKKSCSVLHSAAYALFFDLALFSAIGFSVYIDVMNDLNVVYNKQTSKFCLWGEKIGLKQKDDI